MKNTFLAAVFLCATTLSCSTQNEDKSTPEQVNTEAVKTEDVLQLNNGEKWTVNPEMLVHISKMDSTISSFSESENGDIENLGVSLQENVDNLINSCTMEGDAHNELHKWLMPHIGLLKELKKSQDSELVSELNTSMEEFNTFFE
jgi:hypothetical protein